MTQIKRGFSKGKGTYKGKKLNLPSQEIDRRKKENSAYRTSKPKKGQVKVTRSGVRYIEWEDGSTETIKVNAFQTRVK